jgi:hypothetical protein
MMMMDIKNYYLGTPLARYEYMCIPLKYFPRDIIEKYNLEAMVMDGWMDGWMCIHRNNKGNVCFARSGIISQSAVTNMIYTSWLFPCTSHSWYIVTQNTASGIFSHCGRLRREICGLGQHTSLAQCIAA